MMIFVVIFVVIKPLKIGQFIIDKVKYQTKEKKKKSAVMLNKLEFNKLHDISI